MKDVSDTKTAEIEPNRGKDKKNEKQNSFFIQIIIGLFTGIVFGLFFGDYCAPMKFIGDGFIGLLQMTVLPYITCSLIYCIGKLTNKEAKILAVRGVCLLLILWAIGAFMIILMGIALPKWDMGSFYSNSFLEEPPKMNILHMYIPSNPFYSLTFNLVPAVVLFSIGTGIALMQLKNKHKLLEQLEILTETLKNLNKFVVKLTPVGVFFIIANLSGTMKFRQLELIQVYLIILAIGAVILVFGILPLLIASLTSLKYREIISLSKDALITAFATGSVFVVLPMIVDCTRELAGRSGADLSKDEPEKSTDLIVPMVFPFPTLGRIWVLIFIPFASWFYGNTLSLIQYPKFLSIGILSSFGNLSISLPHLLRMMKIPSDIFNLYMAFIFYTARVAKATKTMFLITFTVLLISWLSGNLKFDWKKILKFAGGSFLTILIITILLKGLFIWTFTNNYSKEMLIKDRQLIGPKVESTVFKEAFPNPVKKKPGETKMERMNRRGIMRVGYDPDELPFTYINGKGELVGFDVDMAHRLAHDLGYKLEFVPFEREKLVEQMKKDHFDIAIGGIQTTLHRVLKLQIPPPYMDITMALVVSDSKRKKFNNLDDIRKRKNLTFAVVRDGFYSEEVSACLPNVKFVEIETESDFFDKEGKGFDGLLTCAETGFAWTLLHPEFAVTNPFKGNIKLSLYYPFLKDDEFCNVLEAWQDGVSKNGMMKRYYDHWILGKEEGKKRPRWCIIRDVMKWVN